jgi:sulfur carrier protein ThiS
MRITFKTSGILVNHLPAGSAGNEIELDVADGAGPIDVIRQLGMPEDGAYLVILNGSTVPKAERAGTKLAEGDRLAVVPPLKGG